jgi:hypothetical protein
VVQIDAEVVDFPLEEAVVRPDAEVVELLSGEAEARLWLSGHVD